MKTLHASEEGERSFEFGRCQLSPSRPSDAIPCGASAILAVCEGAVVVEAAENASRMEARSCALFSGSASLSVSMTVGTDANVLWCSAHVRNPASVLVGDTPPSSDDQLILSDQIDALMRLGLQIENKGIEFEKALRDAVGVAVFSTFRAQAGALVHALTPVSVRKVRNHVDQNFERALNLASLAAVAGVTREQLNVVFRKHVGLTPMRYLWKMRTRRAVDLVQKTDLNLASVAELCGFKSPFHLSREIKRMTGESPRDLRRSRNA